MVVICGELWGMVGKEKYTIENDNFCKCSSVGNSINIKHERKHFDKLKENKNEIKTELSQIRGEKL